MPGDRTVRNLRSIAEALERGLVVLFDGVRVVHSEPEAGALRSHDGQVVLFGAWHELDDMRRVQLLRPADKFVVKSQWDGEMDASEELYNVLLGILRARCRNDEELRSAVLAVDERYREIRHEERLGLVRA